MNFLKFQYVTAFLSIALLLNGCVVDPYYGEDDAYSGESSMSANNVSTVYPNSQTYYPYSMRGYSATYPANTYTAYNVVPLNMMSLGIPRGPNGTFKIQSTIPNGPNLQNTVGYSAPALPRGPNGTFKISNYVPSGQNLQNMLGYHIVQRGETLYGISRHYGLNYRNIAAWNNIRPPYTIWPGQQLLIHAPSGMGIQSVSPPCR